MLGCRNKGINSRCCRRVFSNGYRQILLCPPQPLPVLFGSYFPAHLLLSNWLHPVCLTPVPSSLSPPRSLAAAFSRCLLASACPLLPSSISSSHVPLPPVVHILPIFCSLCFFLPIPPCIPARIFSSFYPHCIGTGRRSTESTEKTVSLVSLIGDLCYNISSSWEEPLHGKSRSAAAALGELSVGMAHSLSVPQDKL